MTGYRYHGKSATTRRHIDDLIKTLTDQNADLTLVSQCLEHLHSILDLLGERPAARSLRKRMGEGNAPVIDVGSADQNAKMNDNNTSIIQITKN